MKVIEPAGLVACMQAGDSQGGHSLELLDVRTAPEYFGAHVPEANLIPLDELNTEAYLRQHKAGEPIYVFCQAGDRARKAIAKFEQAGCYDCVLVDGGTEAWIAAGLPVMRGASTVLPIMRQVQIAVGSLAAIGSVLALAGNHWFALLPLAIGGGLVFAGLTGTCGMALLLARMPWNRQQQNCGSCCAPGEL